MTMQKHLIVGIGASAGGIPALKAFFSKVPANSNIAFVVVTHLSPTRKSLLDQVVGHFAKMPVHVAEDGAQVVPNAVYVMPGNAILSIQAGRLRVVKETPEQRERKPVDVFFSSLAVDQREHAVGIIMSGGDSDGTLGAKAIKENGGFTFAQVAAQVTNGSDAGPDNPEMPQSAIATGLIDFAITAEEMPGKLMEILNGGTALDARLRRGEPDGDHSGMQLEISKLLRSRSGHDFEGYKSETFFRRVARRMQVCQTTTLQAYLDLLRRNPDEIMALFRDLLISVTGFFRDAEAFASLEKHVIPQLLPEDAPRKPVRMWVPGCATGEEVYSLAIMMSERLQGLAANEQVQILATDIDEPAISVARSARYPEELLANVSPERKARFFRKEGASFVVTKEVREMCIFSPHSLISDPPFSGMDLVSCRNLLIYLGADLQRQVIPTLHYALKPGGYLFLGTSESIGEHDDLFDPIDKKRRIFQRRADSGARARMPLSVDTMKMAPHRFDRPQVAAKSRSTGLRQRIERQLLDRHMPPHVVIEQNGEIVHYSSGTGAYLETPSGPPARNLFDLIRQELRMGLRIALRNALDNTVPSVRHTVVNPAEAPQGVSITVERLDGSAEDSNLLLVMFRPSALGVQPAAADHDGEPSAEAALEGELSDARESRHALVEEYETALEELKSANEELFSINEEAQSTNEELQASKEELQSLNEELGTVNIELNSKIEELSRVHTDLRNLYEATRIATVFLDANLMIRNFTPAASGIFNLRPSDIGRPLTDLASVLEYPNLRGQISKVFENGKMIEDRLAHEASGTHYLVRLIPYRDKEKITGVVVAFVDVTKLAHAEMQQNVLIGELNHRVKNMLAVVVSITNTSRKGTKSIEDFTEVLIGRLHGMSRAYDLLSMAAWKSASIRDLVQKEIDLHGVRQIKASGPDIALSPRQTISLGMVIHELSTNAVKYGALSSVSGQVAVGWEVKDGKMHFHWKECGGPRVAPPAQEGFGIVLIRGQIIQELGGTLDMSFAPEGLELTASFALTDVTEAT